jgi:hypothetical protein
MSKNVKYYFKRDGTELCPHTKTKISSPFCLYLCKHCIKKNYVYGWIICEKLNKDAWRKKSEELIDKLLSENQIVIETQLEFDSELELMKCGCLNRYPIIEYRLKEAKNKVANTLKLIKEMESDVYNSNSQYERYFINKIFDHCNINIPKNNQLMNELYNERLISDFLAEVVRDSEIILSNLQDKLINIVEMKNKENINIEIPKGYVPELKDGKVTLVYKGDPLDKMPKSWEELRTVTGEYICGDDNISEARSYDCKKMYKDVIPKGLGKPMLALIQLLQLRNRTWEVTDTKPPDSNGSYNIYFNKSDGRVEGGRSNIAHSVMSFDSEKIRDRFMEYHRDLLWESRELL